MALVDQIIDQRITKLIDDFKDVFINELNLGSQSSKHKSAAFTFLTAKTILNLSDEEVIDGIVDGGNDFGIDAIYFLPPEDGEISITIIQSKYKQNQDGNANFSENGIIKMIDAIRVLFDPNKTLTLNERLQNRIEEIRSFIAEGYIPNICAVAANNGLIWNDITENRIADTKKEFSEQVVWKHIGSEEIIKLTQAKKPIDASLRLTGRSIVEEFSFRRVLLGKMSVLELANLVNNFGDKLLERNIRYYLGLSGSRVNEAVAETLRDSNQRENFYFYNNGITIICSKFSHNGLVREDTSVNISNLQIVNGGQTSKIIQNIYNEIGEEISTAQVLVRIYELQDIDKELVDSITRATNSQNPVDLRDLKSNDLKQKNLADSIKELGYTYQTKREERTSQNNFTSAVIAEAILAVWRHRPHQARFAGAKHFGVLYDTIFSHDLNGAQAVIAALILRQVENRRKRPPKDAPYFLPYGSRFVAMLMGIYLLEDMKIELTQLNHDTFKDAENAIKEKGYDYILKAEKEIESQLNALFKGKDHTLQRLSATFRRSDLINGLTGNSLKGKVNI